MDSTSIDALIAQGYTRVQAIKIHYQQNLKSQPPKVVEGPTTPSPQPFIREAITRIKSQMNPQVDSLNPAQPRKEFGSDADDFSGDASRAYAAENHIVKQQNAEVERKVAQLRAMNDNQQVQRKPLNLRPLASIHGRSGFITTEDIDDEQEEEAVEPVQGDLQLNGVSNLSPVVPESSPAALSPAAPSPSVSSNPPSESEQFIANAMAQGYKRDEAFLMYLRKVNADKADGRSRLGSRAGDMLTNVPDSPSQTKHVFLDISEPTDKKQEKTFYKFINNAMSTESIDVNNESQMAPGKTQRSASNDEAHLAEIQQMKEQQQKLLDELEAQKAQARKLAEEQQAKLREQQEAYERQKQNELLEQKRMIEQLEQQRIQQEQQQRIITQQQEEQKRQLEEQQAQWLAQQQQLQENVLLQQRIFQEQQAEKLKEQERKLAEHQLLLQKQHEEKLMEQKGEQAKMLEEIQLAKKLELQLEERERQKQNDMLEQKRLIEQLELQRIQQEEQHKALLKQQEEQKRLVEEQQRAWVEQQKALQDKLLEQQLLFQKQQAEMQLEQQRKLEEHKLFLQTQQQEKLLEQEREKARIAEEILQAKMQEALIEKQRQQREKELMDEQLEKQRLFQERQQQVLENQARRMQETQEQFLQRQLEEQERQRQELMEQKIADKTQYQLQQQLLLSQQQQQMQQQSQNQMILEEQKMMMGVQQKQAEHHMMLQQQQSFRIQEQHYDVQNKLMEREAALHALHAKRSNISDLSDDEDEEDDGPPIRSNASLNKSGSETLAGMAISTSSRSPMAPQGNKLDQLRKSRNQIEVDDEYDDNNNYLSTSGKMTRGPPIWNTMSPSRQVHKDDNSPYGVNNKSQQMMMNMQQHTPRERLSMNDDDDLSTLSSASHIYSVNNGSAYGAQPVRRTSLGAEIFALEDEMEIERYMSQGYSRDMAVQMFKQRASELNGRGHRRGDSMNISVTDKDKQRRKSQYTIDQRSDNDPAANPDHEALKMGLLLSQQEAEYGINMYDSLIPADDPLIEEYLKMGLTMDEAVLKIFEYKFGKVSTLITEEPSPPRRPTLTKKNSQQYNPPPAPVRLPEEPYRGTPNGNNQGYYTSPATSSSNNSASFYNGRGGPPVGPAISPAASAGSNRSVGGGSRPPVGGHGESYYQPPPQQRPRGDTDVMSVSSYGSSYNMRNMQQQEYVYPPPRLLTPAQASVDDRALEIAMLLSQQESQFGVNMYEDITVQDENEIRKLTARGYSTEDATLAVFERKHQVMPQPPQQMYSPHASNGVAGMGYPMSPSARLLTPVRVGAAPDYRTTPVMHQEPHHAPLQRSQSTYAPTHQPLYNSNPHQDYRMQADYTPPPPRSQSMYTPNTSVTPRAGGGGGVPAGMMNSNNDSFYGETMRVSHSNSEEAINLAMQQSQLDVRSRPGVERVPGVNQTSAASSNGSVSGRPGNTTPVNQARPTSLSSTASSVRVSESDVQQLMSMGFTRDQSVHSLMQNNNNLEVALDRLLTGH